MCLLKFLSWYDRPTERESDIKDIVFVLDRYADIYQDEIFEKFSDWLEGGWHEWLGWRLLGRHIGTIVKGKKDVQKRIIEMLTSNLEETASLPILITRLKKNTVIETITLIEKLYKGIDES